MTVLLAKAVALALKKHKVINARYDESGIYYHNDVNIAVAVAMPDGGLITPVLAKCDDQDVYSLARTWKDLLARARGKQLSPAEFTTGTFTISNLGMFGVDRFDAILPVGTGGILAVGGTQTSLVTQKDGSLCMQDIMTVNLTADHRTVYGADGAQFLQELKKIIEEPSVLLY